MRVILFAFLGAAVAGFLAAKLLSDERGTEVVELEGQRDREIRKERWKSETFAAWASEKANAFDPFSSEWNEWSDKEIRDALDAGIVDPRAASNLSDERRIIGALFGEWMKRHPDEAILWMENLKSDSMRRSLIPIVGRNWPTDQRVEGLAYVIAHRDWFESNNGTASGELIRGAIDDAAKKGPDAVGELFGKLRENRLDPRYAKGWEFPPDFDFVKLMEHPETRLLKTYFFSGIWMSRSPDEAFHHLVASRKPEEVQVGYLFVDMLPTNGPKRSEEAASRAEWLGRKMESLDAEDQRVIARKVSEQLNDVAAQGRFAGSLSDETLRKEIVASSLKNSAKGGIGSILTFVENAGEGEQRIDILEAFEKPKGVWVFPTESEEMLRRKLAEWNAPPERMENIIKKLSVR